MSIFALYNVALFKGATLRLEESLSPGSDRGFLLICITALKLSRT
jgi:hypothetical protein